MIKSCNIFLYILFKQSAFSYLNTRYREMKLAMIKRYPNASSALHYYRSVSL